ncbi:hypothetical protein [Collinsella sp. An2]|uniref:anti-sigma-I factor RsgI family protein n=1 Tax=Collinsella sp. An2 TaxID=1965585 RepID=UPI000B3B0611|nr:hypothetical protein [Collinsella sp. An2]OUP10857.1 hypothetical protein B5F33_00235 [Collinsella sp. An2]
MTDDVKRRLQDAFDNAHVPADLAERTLERIEQIRTADQAGGSGQTAPAGRTHKLAEQPAADEHDPSPSIPQHRKASDDQPHLSLVAQKRPAASPQRRRHIVLAAAACLLLVLLGIGGVAWASTPYAYIGIDVNPSLELGINRFDCVADTRAYNKDGEQVLQQADVQGKSYEEALAAIDDALQDYLTQDAVIELTIVCDDRDAAARLESTGVHCLDTDQTGQVHCSHASEAEHHEASDHDMGLGKYRIYRQLVDAGMSISAEDAESMTMRELLDLAQQHGVGVAVHDSRDEEEHLHRDQEATAAAGEDAEHESAGNALETGHAHRRHTSASLD